MEVRDPGSARIYIYDIEGNNPRQLTFGPGRDQFPLWTPAGDMVVFYSDRDGGGVFRRAADGTGDAELLATGAYYPFSWDTGWHPGPVRSRHGCF